DRIYAALASVPEYYAALVSPWQQANGRLHLSPLVERIVNSTHSVAFDPMKIISDPVEWCQLDYTVGASVRAAAEVLLVAARDGTAHGICLWFKAILLDEIEYSTEPGQPDNVYG